MYESYVTLSCVPSIAMCLSILDEISLGFGQKLLNQCGLTEDRQKNTHEVNHLDDRNEGYEK